MFASFANILVENSMPVRIDHIEIHLVGSEVVANKAGADRIDDLVVGALDKADGTFDIAETVFQLVYDPPEFV